MAQPRRKSTSEQISLFPAMELLPGRVQDGHELTISGRVERVLFAGAQRGRMEIMVATRGGLHAEGRRPRRSGVAGRGRRRQGPLGSGSQVWATV